MARRHRSSPIAIALALPFLATAAWGQWVDFTNETSSRLVAPPALGANDVEEKDFAYADLDLDGDIDLITVRKQPFTSGGRRPNVLFMNEGGVLVDRSTEYASDADVPGDQGFLTPTNDRDVVIGDFNGDGWPDFVTVPALSDGQPKSISHPRVYVNLGEDGGGNWLGFRYEDARIPQLAGLTGGVPHAPRFSAVDAGDIDGDGDFDLYFTDYDSGPPQTLDFNDRLLVNDGNGFFADETATRFLNSIVVSGIPYPFPLSAFGTSVALADFNGDGFVDIAKNTALNPPQYVGISYNNGTAGPDQRFEDHDVIYQISPYFIEAGDLNNDGRMDLLTMDASQDRYQLNTTPAGASQATFTQLAFSFVDGQSDYGFAGNSRIADLDNDGFLDVYHCDVDIDIPGCARRAVLYRNLGDTPNVTLESQTGLQPYTPTGVHDVAIFDIDGDGRNDLVIGRCVGTEVHRNVPPAGLTFSYPNGLFNYPDGPAPANTPCGQDATVTVEVNGFGGAVPQAGAFRFQLSTNRGPFLSQPFIPLGPDLYEVTFPAGALGDTYQFYFEADDTDGTTYVDPSASAPYLVVVADGLIEDVHDFETASGWTVETGTALASGAWERADPNATFTGFGTLSIQAAPEDDATEGAAAVLAYVTGNGPAGAIAGDWDVDGSFNHLISPTFDLSGTDGFVRFAAWHFNNDVDFDPPEADELVISISNDGGSSWVDAYTVSHNTAGWETHLFQVSNFVPPTSNMRVRFSLEDDPNNSLAEAGVDDFTIVRLYCSSLTEFVRTDANDDGMFDLSDPIALLAYVFSGGATPSCLKAADANDDGSVDISDAVAMLAALFTGGVSPPAPFPNCGMDPTPDSLSCDSFSTCP